jgi:hypothetical protein
MAASLVLHLTGGSANSDPNASLGGVRSSVEVSATALNNLFDNVSPDEATAGDLEYRAVDLVNTGDATAVSVALSFNPNTSSVDTALAVATEASPIDSTLAIADESTAPAGGLTFTEPTPAAKQSLPDIAAGSGCRLWLRRTVGAAAGNTANDTATLQWEYA